MGFLGWSAEAGVRFEGFLFFFPREDRGVAYELALGGSFGVGGTGVEGNASYQHGSRQWRDALWKTDGRQRSVSRGHAMQRLKRSLLRGVPWG